MDFKDFATTRGWVIDNQQMFPASFIGGSYVRAGSQTCEDQDISELR